MSETRSLRSKYRRTKRRRLIAEPLEGRRLLAASLGWDGPGLGSAELTYHIANSPSSLSQAETNAAIETALDAWSGAADITFTPTNQSGLRDSIDISFTNIDGVGGTLAQAYFPDDVNPARIAGDIQFDTSDAWEVGNSNGNQAFDLVYVAVHEIGHSLGLEHTDDLDSVLTPFVSPNQSFSTLDSHDVVSIQGLYAAADGSTTTETPVDESRVDEAPVDDTPTTETPTNETDADETDTDSDDQSDSDDDPFPVRRWRRSGHWHRWGGRLDAEAPKFNYVNPTDANSDGNTSALDALMIINQLDGDSVSDDVDIAGLCDTNGDGAITALDALTVINSLANSSVDSTTTGDGVDSTEVSDGAEDVDLANKVDDTNNAVDDTTDPVEEVDETETEETDTTDEPEDMIDDGGLVDETDDDTDHHTGGHHHHSGIFNVGLFGKDAESLITRFDTNEDAALGEEEVPERLWAKLLDAEVDTDTDGLATLTELETEITNARQEAFNEKDTDTDGVLTESEVSERLWTKISAADTDANGGVSLDELDTFRAQRQGAQSDNDPTEPGERSHRHRHHGRSSDEVFAAIGRAASRR